MSATDSIRYVIYPNDRRDVHDIAEKRVAKFPDSATASNAAHALTNGHVRADDYEWEDYK